ncbi:RNA polymerase sigma factor SigZ [Enhygromyxa salina]|uniref:RNA polymerase sigma factor SigZ n=1 Tax=Enhygromyxa salina TaxID=215803 RepID=A0A0C2A251_9BACT|nr:sigma-70 family RNA polymerase sigma factor [Enhygromyxa salina]KIG17483.1 RNA polymerase sigma factor SigZ [Enhygromyxa salina]
MTAATRDSSSALAQLLAQREALLAFAVRRVGDPALAEDILQDTFAKSVQQLAEIRRPEAARAWFYRVLRNACADSHRSRARLQRTVDAVTVEASLHEHPPELDALDRGCRCVAQVAAELRPAYAEALSRIDVDGLAVKDFAAERGLSASNAGVRIHRARRALAKDLVEHCGACASLGCADCTCSS